MEEQLMVDKNYLKGFNHGYLLATHEPDLVNKIVSNKNDHNEYFKGIVAGKQEHDMEKVRERLKGISRNNPPTKEITKNKGKER